MADPTWPATIPSEPEQSGYDEKLAISSSIFEPDVGPPTTWRRSTADGAAIKATIIMTDAERDLFKTFYRSTLRDGSRAFNWTNPAYGSSARHLFDPGNPPVFVNIGAALWRVTLQIIRLA
jgi:hypothetical protein